MSLGVLIKQILELLALSSEKMGFDKGRSLIRAFINKKRHSFSHLLLLSLR